MSTVGVPWCRRCPTPRRLGLAEAPSRAATGKPGEHSNQIGMYFAGIHACPPAAGGVTLALPRSELTRPTIS